MYRKILAIMLIMILASVAVDIRAFADEKEPDITGQFGIAMDAETGEILYNKHADDKAYPASITKIITAILLDEKVKDGTKMNVSEWAAGQEASNSHFRLEAGEKISKEDAMKALLIISANDAAVTIAEHVAGSQEEFAKLMTKRAKKIGAKNTSFMTASGLHDPNHYTTAHDMALITQEALKHPNVLKILGTKKAKIKTNKRSVVITNPSKIHDNPIAIGGKTGYTNTARNTLVEILEKDGKKVITVVMKSTLAQEYKDIEIMGDYAFPRMDKKYVIEKNQMLKSVTINGETVHALAKNRYVAAYSSDEDEFKKKVEIDKPSTKTVSKGEKIGVVKVYKNQKQVREIPLISDRKIQSSSHHEKEQAIKAVEKPKQEDKPITWLLILIGVVITAGLYVGYVIHYNVRRSRKIKEYEK